MTALAITADVFFVFALMAFFLNSGRLFGPHPVHQGDADIPFETGERPFEPALGHMSIYYWRFAVLFVAFDVDLAFLMPWILCRSSLNAFEMVGINVFMGLIALMLAYFWRKGVLECR